eukprot:gene5292-5959_t
MEPVNNVSDEMLFGNIIDQLSLAAFLDVDTLESIASTIDAKLESLQEASDAFEIEQSSAGAINLNGEHNTQCNTDALALNCFLTNIVQALKRNPGFEDSILKDFLIFCSRNGLILPPVDSMMFDVQGSAASLNTLTIADEELRTSLWTEIRSRIKTGITTKLRQSNLLNRSEYEQPGYQKEILRRIQIIDLLMTLFPVEGILELYSAVRVDQLDMYLTGTKKYSVSWADEEGSDKIKELENLEAFVVSQLDMLNMDVPILWTVSKSIPEFSIVEYIDSIYYCKLQSSLSKVIRSFFAQASDVGAGMGNLLLPSAAIRTAKTEEETSWKDVQFMSKVFAMIWNWENEVTELIAYYSVKDDLQDDSQGLRSVLKASPNENPSQSKQQRLDQIIWDKDKDKDRSRSKCSVKWTWREQFKPVVHALASRIDDDLGKLHAVLEMENTGIDSTLVDLNDRFAHANTEYPFQVSKKYAIIFSTFDEALPLACHGGGLHFQPIRTAFVEAVGACLRECYSDLLQVVDSFKDCSGFPAVYNAFCSTAFVARHLRFYEENIALDESKPFRDVIKLYDELLIKTRSTIISCHLKVLSTMVLFDANSNNWSDNKQFYEGERYSYCIQLWSYYLRCVHADIWSKLPLSESKKILFAITDHSLTNLVGRYSKASPSHARISQYCADVTAMCDVTVWVMGLLADSLSSLISPEINGPQMNQWHSLCSSMLANMVTVVSLPYDPALKFLLSAPLKLLADNLNLKYKGDGSDLCEDIDKNSFDPKKLLLMWSEPCIFTKSLQSINELGDREAIFLVFRMVVCSPTPNWPLILQAMLMRGALLPALIANNSGCYVERSRQVRDSGFKCSQMNENFIETTGYTTSKLKVQEFISDVYDILFKVSAKSDALAHFLMALANCENTWSLFDNHIVVGSKETCETPKWLLNIEKSLIPFLSRTFVPSLEILCESDRLRCQPSFAFTNLETLPCGCAATKDDGTGHHASEGELLYQCLVSTLESLTESLNTMPRIIAVFFSRLNEYLYQRHFSAATKSPGLKILAFISYKWLTVQENIGLLFDFPISDDTMEKVKCFAELVWHVLFNVSTDVSQNSFIPTEIMCYIKGKRNWLQEKLKILTNFFKASVVNSTNSCLDQSPYDFAEVQYTVLATTLLAMPDGYALLRRIFNVFKANKRTIEEKLFSLRVADEATKVCRKLPFVNESQDDMFNPLIEYRIFGDYLHNQEESIDSQHDWYKWLPILDLFSHSHLRSIILRRQEFQPDSYDYLTDEEKIAHEELLSLLARKSSPAQRQNYNSVQDCSENSACSGSQPAQSTESK